MKALKGATLFFCYDPALRRFLFPFSLKVCGSGPGKRHMFLQLLFLVSCGQAKLTTCYNTEKEQKKMAKAGFIHTPTENSPDIAMCFFCLKELEGWEPEDDPEKEHKSHSPSCNFICLKKGVTDLTVEDFIKLQKEKQKFHIKKAGKEDITKFEEAAKRTRVEIIKTAKDEE
uniref:Baculoviral IAP repeat-containing protein 5 n=2 Tax=Esox lucius TaxID=8010 RepID=A0AAY5KIK5_ESOLU